MMLSSSKVFISYSHKDDKFKKELEKHLAPLQSKKLISIWHDRKIYAGSDWEHEIDINLEDSEIILLLFSPEFFASDYCNGKEAALALEKHELGEAYVIPIIIRDCIIPDNQFTSIQSLPSNLKPVKKWRDRDSAWKDVVLGIERRLKEMNHRKEKAKKDNKTNIAESINSGLSDAFDLIENYYKKKSYAGHPTGFDCFDNLINGLQKSDFIVIASRANLKTDFVLNIARNVSVSSRTPVGFFSMRLSNTEIAWQILTSDAGVDSHKMSRGQLPLNDWGRLSRSVGVLAESPLFIDDTFNLSIGEIKVKASRLKEEHGCEVIIIDTIQHLSESDEVNSNKIESISRSLKKIAKELDITVIGTSRISNYPKQVPSMPLEIVHLGDSSCLEEDADVIAFLVEKHDTLQLSANEVLVNLQLVKNKHGNLGTTELMYFRKWPAFINLEKNHDD